VKAKLRYCWAFTPLELFKALKSYSQKRAMAKDVKGKEAISKDYLPSEIVHL
jgi:hypothetical protein